MGYTHYWSFNKGPHGKGNAALSESLWQTAMSECALIARTWNKECKAQGRDADRLSGFSAHTKPSQGYGGLHINGKGELAHEDFTMPEHFRDNFEADYNGFNFCKTARKPYDLVVTACLAVIKHRMGDRITVTSDGRAIDWNDGVDYARCITRLAIKHPVAERTEREVA